MKKTILVSRKERTHLLNYNCCVNSAGMKSIKSKRLTQIYTAITRPRIKISYGFVRAELSGTKRHLFPVITKSVNLFVEPGLQHAVIL